MELLVTLETEPACQEVLMGLAARVRQRDQLSEIAVVTRPEELADHLPRAERARFVTYSARGHVSAATGQLIGLLECGGRGPAFDWYEIVDVSDPGSLETLLRACGGETEGLSGQREAFRSYLAPSGRFLDDFLRSVGKSGSERIRLVLAPGGGPADEVH